MISDADRVALGRAIEVAGAAVVAGEQPFAAVLVAADGTELTVAHNRTAAGDPTAHAELLIASWAVERLSLEQRAATVLYCTGEPCPMCAGAHGWAGLGRIVFAVSAAGIVRWLVALGGSSPPVNPLQVRDVLPGTPVDGPLPAGDEQVAALQGLFRRAHG